MEKKIAINGFGRIGRTFLRILLENKAACKDITVTAINIGPSSPDHLTHFFKYDTILGKFDGDVSSSNNTLTINGQCITIIAESDPRKINWKKIDIDWIVDASGYFRTREKAQQHIDAGAKKVLITAPATDEDVTIIPGVNDDTYNAQKHHIVSLGSCTTNCFAPMVKVLKDTFDLQNGLMTTIHAYTNDQVLLDVEHKDPRRARAAALNMIPTKTGADKVIVKIFPELAGKIAAHCVRVPTPIVSLVDFTFTTKDTLTIETVNTAFKKAADSNLKNILGFCDEPLVSSDFAQSPYSCIIDSRITKVAGNMGKVFGWYDNEYGYCCRLKDFLLHIA